MGFKCPTRKGLANFLQEVSVNIGFSVQSIPREIIDLWTMSITWRLSFWILMHNKIFIHHVKTKSSVWHIKMNLTVLAQSMNLSRHFNHSLWERVYKMNWKFHLTRARSTSCFNNSKVWCWKREILKGKQISKLQNLNFRNRLV